MDNDEVEFIAENEQIIIVPNFQYKTLHLIGGDIGPFEPSVPTTVPLWLAVHFRQRQKCRIECPSWINVEKLEELINAERESELFTHMPNPHYMEITNVLLNCAAQDIPRADEVKTLIKDIWDLRIAKLRSSMNEFIKSDSLHAKVNNLTLLEINTVRNLLTKSLKELYKLKAYAQGGEE